MAILAYCSNCCQRGAARPDSQLRRAPDQQSFRSEFRTGANGESFAFNGCELVKRRESQKRSGKSLCFGSVAASHKIGTEFRSLRVRMEGWRQWRLGGRKTLSTEKTKEPT